MPSKTSSKIPAAMSWWLNAGDEECSHCGQLYIYEVEFRCIECDGPGCPHCRVVHAEGHLICPACAPVKAVTKKSARRG